VGEEAEVGMKRAHEWAVWFNGKPRNNRKKGMGCLEWVSVEKKKTQTSFRRLNEKIKHSKTEMRRNRGGRLKGIKRKKLLTACRTKQIATSSPTERERSIGHPDAALLKKKRQGKKEEGNGKGFCRDDG